MIWPRCYACFKDREVGTRVDEALDRLGVEQVSDRCQATYLLTDQPSLAEGRAVIIVDPVRTMTARAALQALHEGRALGVLSTTGLPGNVGAALGGPDHDALIVARSVLQKALDAPMVTPRQDQVRQLLGHGLANRLIAARLHVSLATVKRDVSQMLRTFGVTNRTELMHRAAELGFS